MNLDNEMFYLTEHEIDCLDELSMPEIYSIYACISDDFNTYFISSLERYIGERFMYGMFLQAERK